jgi:hypothetical protein
MSLTEDLMTNFWVRIWIFNWNAFLYMSRQNQPLQRFTCTWLKTRISMQCDAQVQSIERSFRGQIYEPLQRWTKTQQVLFRPRKAV